MADALTILDADTDLDALLGTDSFEAHIARWQELSSVENYRAVTLERCAGNALIFLLGFCSAVGFAVML